MQHAGQGMPDQALCGDIFQPVPLSNARVVDNILRQWNSMLESDRGCAAKQVCKSEHQASHANNVQALLQDGLSEMIYCARRQEQEAQMKVPRVTEHKGKWAHVKL